MLTMKSQAAKICLNIAFCLLSSILSFADNVNCWEYIITSKFHSEFLKYIIFLSAIIHPVSLLLYHCLSLTYLHYLEEEDFKNLIKEKEFHEMIFFRHKVRQSAFLIIPIAVYLTLITYTKFFCFYSLKFLIESPSSYEVFFNVITTTLYNPIIIQVIFQSFPQIILQTTNNLLIMEDNHSFHFRGVVNFSTIISILFILNLSFLYLREKKLINQSDRDNYNNFSNSSIQQNNTSYIQTQIEDHETKNKYNTGIFLS